MEIGLFPLIMLYGETTIHVRQIYAVFFCSKREKKKLPKSIFLLFRYGGKYQFADKL